MFKTISLVLSDGETKKDFNFLAVGTTSYRYKQIFRSDLMKDITRLVNRELDFIGDEADFSVTDKLAFIMNCQAEKMDMNNLNFDMFIEWLEQFDSATLFAHLNDFINIYLGNKESTSNPKKEGEQ